MPYLPHSMKFQIILALIPSLNLQLDTYTCEKSMLAVTLKKINI